ncbi:hypothetical protein [Mucilaginibacter sp.]|nr:hypothetical protein [Mucilaginibacter sp.]MDR3695673.1 hypothetical protein [Mucilaginibacter sp.]
MNEPTKEFMDAFKEQIITVIIVRATAFTFPPGDAKYRVSYDENIAV